MAGIDAQVAAPCTVPVPAHVMSTMTIAGSRTSTTTAATMTSRRLTGILAGLLASGVLAALLLRLVGIVMR